MDTIDDRDYIAVDRQTMIDFHGRYTFLEGDEKLDLFETNQIINLPTNPLTNQTLTQEELQYIKFHDECYKYTGDMELSPETLQQFFTWYADSRRAGATVEALRDSPDTAQAYNIVRYYLTATDFQSHFRNFNPTDSDKEAYERDLAEKALRTSKTIGKWLLRHSSRNRPVSEEAQDKLQRLGYRYYALSYIAKDAQIKHLLITCKVGKGWSTFGSWYTNFVDVLEEALIKSGLVFYQQIQGYITVNY